MRRTKLLLLLIPVLILAGCGASTKTQEVTFENFKMNIDTDFKKVDATVVDNKYITHKVLLSFKKAANNGFADNFMVGKSAISSGIDTTKFAQMVTAKLEGQVYGASIVKTDSLSFKCGTEDISGNYTVFTTPTNVNSTDSNQKNYYFQYYFIKGGNGYIISFGSNNQKATDSFLTNVKTLNCNQ